jgi:hypothetical protein
MGSISLKTKSKSNNLTAPGDVDLGAMIPLMTTTVDTAVSAVTFSDIPQAYEHLQIRAILKTNENSSGATNIEMRLNSDTGSNYTRHYLRGTGSAADAGAATSQSKFTVGTAIQSSAALANMFGAMVVDILDYTNTNKYTTVRAISGQDTNTSGTQGMWLQSGLWLNTAAITNISLFSSSSNINQYSSFALYGIKRAGA